jgi:hypothetical protein
MDCERVGKCASQFFIAVTKYPRKITNRRNMTSSLWPIVRQIIVVGKTWSSKVAYFMADKKEREKEEIGRERERERERD